jgi:tetratricopeptide (TPR) repeat protein
MSYHDGGTSVTSSELGAWLRQQREARGWPKAEMARRLVQAGRDSGDKAMPTTSGMLHNIHRWEREGGLSERHKLHYCRTLGIPASQFGPRQGTELPDQATTQAIIQPASASPGTRLVPGLGLNRIPDLADPHLPIPPVIAYRGRREPGLERFTVEQEVVMAAHEASDHAAEHEQHSVGEATLEQLRADLIRLAGLSSAGSPLPAFLEMRRVRDKVYRLLDRRSRPREQADLYFLAGCINELMGLTANRLGYPDAAEELIRAGWAYANVIDHHALRGMLRARLSYVMYWRGWLSESRDLAADGLRYAPQGLPAANLYLEHARALARLGDGDAARSAVSLAHAAQESEYHDDLMDIGGEEFALSQASAYSMAGGALAEVDGAEREAEAELERALSLYDEGPGPGEQHGFAGKALAGTDLAAVRLRSGALDAAAAALEPVLNLAPSQRISTLTIRLRRVRNELTAPVFRGSAQAREIGDQIEAFSREAITSGLHALAN